MAQESGNLERYQRQIAFGGLGLAGQKRLASAGALIVGVGGLGSWMAELLARAGVGFLRLVDGDTVELTNLHRQALYDELDASMTPNKAQAAARRLGQINSEVKIEAVPDQLTRDNIAALSKGVQVILDGTDNFAVRFIINDYAVKHALPWVFSGVIGTEAQTMTIVPGRTPCLRCLFETPPPPCSDPSCRVTGVLGPAVSAIASLAAAEAIKLLSGQDDKISPYLLKMDLWANTVQRIDTAQACREVRCPCCKDRQFEYLEP